MGINQIDIETRSFKIKFASVPIFNPTKRKVEIISNETAKNKNKTRKSIVYVNLYNLILRVLINHNFVLKNFSLLVWEKKFFVSICRIIFP
jgi:hypothetical protein